MKIGWVGKKWGSRHKHVGPNYKRFGVFETSPELLFSVQPGYFPVFHSPGPHPRGPREHAGQCHPGDRHPDRVRHQEKGTDAVSGALPWDQTGRPLLFEIPMDELQASLPAFKRQLLAHGYGLYSIDYMQDFSGVLDREALADHLCAFEGFREQGDLAAMMCEGMPMILSNIDSVGEHVCTWVGSSEAGYMVQTKLYNKVVSNFEAGKVHEPIGGHLADYVDCPNQHLRCTFLLHDVQTQRCTHIEVSLYSCGGWDLSANTATEVVAEALALVSPVGLAGGKRLVCGPAACLAMGEPGHLPRSVPCAGRLATRVYIRGLVCAHDDGQGLRCPGSTHQGERRQRSNLGEGHRMSCGRFRVPRMPHLPGRHPGSRRGGRGTCPSLMLHQGLRHRHGLGCQQAAYPAASERPRPQDPLAAFSHCLLGLEKGQVPSSGHRDLCLPPPKSHRAAQSLRSRPGTMKSVSKISGMRRASRSGGNAPGLD